jgi:hypothetical protein
MHGTASAPHAFCITAEPHHRLATAIHRRNRIISCNFQFTEIAARISGSSGASTVPHTAARWPYVCATDAWYCRRPACLLHHRGAPPQTHRNDSPSLLDFPQSAAIFNLRKSPLESQDRPGRPPCLTQPPGDPTCAQPMHGTAGDPHAFWISAYHAHRPATGIHRHNWISHNRLQFSIFRNRRSNRRIVQAVHRASHSHLVTLRVRTRCMVQQAPRMLFVSPRSTTTDSRQRSTVAIGLTAAIFNFQKSPLESQDRPGRLPCLNTAIW